MTRADPSGYKRLDITVFEGDSVGHIKICSPAGDAERTFDLRELPPSLRYWTPSRTETEIAEPRRATVRRDELGQPRPPVGEQLFDLLFSGNIGKILAGSIALAEAGNYSLRFVVNLTGAKLLGQMPVELLCDPSSKRHFAQDSKTPWARSLPVGAVPREVTVEPPFRILLVAASPQPHNRLELELEEREITRALEPLLESEVVILEQLNSSTLRHLSERLAGTSYDGIHFMGHGSFKSEGSLILEKEDGRAEEADLTKVETLLAQQQRLKLMVFNCCLSARSTPGHPWTGLAQAAFRRNIPAVVGMRTSVMDQSAIAFSRGFYRDLAQGAPVDVAVNSGRREIRATVPEAGEEWSAPLLFLRGSEVPALPLARPRRMPLEAVGEHLVKQKWREIGRLRPLRICVLASLGLALPLILAGILVMATFQLIHPDYKLRSDASLIVALAAFLIVPAWGLALGIFRSLRRKSPLLGAASAAIGLALAGAISLWWMTGR